MTTIRIKHPLMGVVEGVQQETVAQFLGIKYGHLRDRLAEPELQEYNQGSVVDAKQYGPHPIFPVSFLSLETAFIQQDLPVNNAPGMSDLEGLNLNITVPLIDGKPPSQDQLLPVLVFVHGGAFFFGSNWYPHFNQDDFVSLAMGKACPIVAVNFNYRLGLSGLLTSTELRAAGYKANNSLLDQQTAFKWIERHIGGFGGDPNSMTAIGQSAGAISISYLLQSELRLFNQAILMGGTSIVIPAISIEAADAVYAALMHEFGWAELSAQERIDSLLQVSPETIMSKVTPAVGLGLVLDGHLIKDEHSFDSISTESDRIFPGKQWCKRLFLIHSNFDASITGTLALSHRVNGLRDAFIKNIQSHLQEVPEQADRLLNTYGFDSKMSDEEALSRCLQFANDLLFYAPAMTMATVWPESHLGNFNEGNPWDGPNKGKANHMLDTAFLWQKYNSRLNDKQRDIAIAFAEDILRFTAGVVRLPSFKETKEALFWGPSADNLVRGATQLESSESGRETQLVRALRECGGFATLFKALNAFLKSP